MESKVRLPGLYMMGGYSKVCFVSAQYDEMSDEICKSWFNFIIVGFIPDWVYSC